MRRVERSALVAYTNRQMYDLVADVPRYHEFLPWCSGSSQTAEADGTFLATVEISIAGMRNAFTTRNTNHPPSRIELALVKGPFRTLHGEWQFNPREAGAGEGADGTGTSGNNASPAAGSEVILRLNYDFSSSFLSAAVAPVFDRISDTLVDAFVDRAKSIY